VTSARCSGDRLPFFTSPDGGEFVVPMSLVGSLSFPFYLNAMRRQDLADDPRFRTPQLRRVHLAELHAIVQTWINTFEDMASLDAQLDEAKIATGQLRDVREFAASEWATAWGLTREVSDRAGGSITIPGTAVHFSAHDGRLRRRCGRCRGSTTPSCSRNSATRGADRGAGPGRGVVDAGPGRPCGGSE